MPIIFNEREHAKIVIEKGFQTSRNKSFELQLVANYLREQGYSDKEIEEELHRISKRNFTDYNKVQMYDFIDNKVKKSKKGKLKENFPVYITRAEMNTILSESNIKYQKLLFVYLVLAKFYMNNNKADKYYVGCEDNDIFKLCDMYTRKQEKLDMMHYLTVKGYIKPTLSMSSIVNYVNEDSEVVMEVIPNEDMIYRFEKEYLGGIFINCEICGRLVKKTNNRIKYCKKCSKKIHNSR
ncbi:MAG: hypothetical protein MSS80_08360 [Mollicutes bacterium]|nr:hypothetical protein [Mollicutes bacterium]